MRRLAAWTAILSIVLFVPSCGDDEPIYRALNSEDDCLLVEVIEDTGDDDDATPGDDDDSSGAGDDDDATPGDDDDATPGDDDDATPGDDDDSATGDDDDSATGDDDDSAAGDDDDSATGDDDDDSASGDDDDSAGARDGDDDDSASDVTDDIPEDAVWTELTCCGNHEVIGEAWVSPESAPPGETHLRYAGVRVYRDVFEANGYDLSEIVRVTVSFDSRDVGEGEAELEQNGLDETLWEGWLGCGELGGVPRTDEFCFHLWGEEEPEEE
jgi:hypothetical protein